MLAQTADTEAKKGDDVVLHVGKTKPQSTSQEQGKTSGLCKARVQKRNSSRVTRSIYDQCILSAGLIVNLPPSVSLFEYL